MRKNETLSNIRWIVLPLTKLGKGAKGTGGGTGVQIESHFEQVNFVMRIKHELAI